MEYDASVPFLREKDLARDNSVTWEDIVAGYKIFKEKGANTVVVAEKSLQLPEYYRIIGAIYITMVKQLEHIDDIYRDKCFVYGVLP